jgi:hypothetical protein
VHAVAVEVVERDVQKACQGGEQVHTQAGAALARSLEHAQEQLRAREADRNRPEQRVRMTAVMREVRELTVVAHEVDD